MDRTTNAGRGPTRRGFIGLLAGGAAIGAAVGYTISQDSGKSTPSYTAAARLARMTVYLVTSGEIDALHAESGAVRWSSPLLSSLLTAGSRGVYATGAEDGRMYCFDPMTGAIKWTHRIIQPINFADWLYPYPSFSGNLVYIAPGDGNFYALDAVTGNLRWQHHLPVGSYGQAPLVYRGVVCVGSPDAYVYAFDAVTGEFRWRFGKGSSSQNFGVGELQAARGKIYTKGSNSLYALDPQSGKVLEILPFALPCGNGVAYSGSADGTLRAREIANSKFLLDSQT